MAGGKGGKSQSRGSSKKLHRGRGHNYRRGRELGDRNADEWDSGEKPESIIEATGDEGDDAEHGEGVH
jgi:hypothetical protein